MHQRESATGIHVSPPSEPRSLSSPPHPTATGIHVSPPSEPPCLSSPPHPTATGVHVSPPSEPPCLSSPPRPPLGCHRAGRWGPCVTRKPPWLSVSHAIVHVCPCYAPSSSHLSSLLWPRVCSLRLRLHCCPASSFMRTIFLDSIHMHSYTIFVFLFVTDLLCIIGSKLIHLIRTDSSSIPGRNPLEEGMASYSSILAWRNPWTEEPGGLQAMESQRIRHD